MSGPGHGEQPLGVLIVEDEPAIVEFLTLGFTYEGYTVHSVHSGAEALPAFARLQPDLVILDIMLPEVDGLTLCRQIRARSDVPIIMLTARGDVEDRILGLDSGADDYLPKPFKFAELMARIRAVLRRHQPPAANVLTSGDLTLNRDTREVTLAGQPLTLTAREFELLEYLMLYPRKVLTREAILREVWGYDQAVSSNVVDVYIRYLRTKLQDDQHQRIQSIRGVGYMLQP